MVTKAKMIASGRFDQVAEEISQLDGWVNIKEEDLKEGKFYALKIKGVTKVLLQPKLPKCGCYSAMHKNFYGIGNEIVKDVTHCILLPSLSEGKKEPIYLC